MSSPNLQAGEPADFPVVIIGAGVNGAGLFRDLCEQGVDCLLVDKADFGSGASAAPSRLIHGGLKYLETGEFRLVAQSTLERNLLLKNAPHLVAPLPTLIPIFSWTRGVLAAIRTMLGSTTAPRSRGALLIKIGLQIYDYYGARQRAMPGHAMIARQAALRDIPALNPEIVALGSYYDAKISMPERLVFELVADGLVANATSAALNYAKLERHEGGILTFSDRNGAKLAVRPRIVVNAAGPWIDQVNAALGERTKMIGGTKGSHLLLKHDELVRSLAGRMIYFEADDGRICLVYEYLGMALVGSTDIAVDDPDAAHCEEPEIDYFLQSLGALLPGLRFDRSQIVYTYAGVRPLPASSAANPGLISRDHSSPKLPPHDRRPFAIVSLVGGKWTTFRGFAEEVADKLLAELGRGRRISTVALPIGGGRGFPKGGAERKRWLESAATVTGLPPERLEALLSRYGTTALAIARHVSEHEGAQPMQTLPDYLKGEIDYIARSEEIAHLTDLVMRRTSLAIEGVLTKENFAEIAEIAGAALGWSEGRQAAEIEAAILELSNRHSYRFERHVSSRDPAITT